MRKLFFTILFLFVFTSLIHSQSGYSIEIQRTETGKIFTRSAEKKSIDFYFHDMDQSSVSVIETQALKFDGVISFSISTDEIDGKRKVQASFKTDFNAVSFQKLMIILNIQNIIIGERTVEAKNIGDVIDNDPQYRAELRKVNQRIDDIQKKIDWVLENEEEKALAEENGWFDEAYQTLEEAKQERAALIQNNCK